MKLKDINKIKELIAERLDTQYDREANWKQEETRNGESMWVHRDDTFEINVFYWTKRETNRGTWVTMPVAKRSATVVMEFTDRDETRVRRTVSIDFYDGLKIPEEDIDSVKISTYTDLLVGSHHCASYTKSFDVRKREATLDDWRWNGGSGYMKLIWEIFDGKG
jgi:hypothetical protein